MTAIEEIAELKSKLNLAEAGMAAAHATATELSDLQEKMSTLALEVSLLKSDLAVAITARDSAIAAQGVAEKALADGKAALDLEANKKALAIVAGQGGTVVKIDADEQNKQPQTLTEKALAAIKNSTK